MNGEIDAVCSSSYHSRLVTEPELLANETKHEGVQHFLSGEVAFEVRSCQRCQAELRVFVGGARR